MSTQLGQPFVSKYEDGYSELSSSSHYAMRVDATTISDARSQQAQHGVCHFAV